MVYSAGVGSVPCEAPPTPNQFSQSNDFHLRCRLGARSAAAAYPHPSLEHREQEHPHQEVQEEWDDVEGDCCPLWVLSFHSKEVVPDLITRPQRSGVE